jgi:autotransporter-associated beta strand protein
MKTMKKMMTLLAVAGLVLALAPAAQAAAITWIGGVSANWNTTEANWTGGPSEGYWVNGHDAVFEYGALAEPKLITVGTSITANSVHTSLATGDGYPDITFQGSALTLVGDAIWTANDDQAVLKMALTGTVGLTKLGDNILRLSTGSTYTGNTTISAGTLRFNVATLGGGTYAGNISIASGATLSYERGVQTFNGIISGTGTLSLGDTQTSHSLTLGGVNIFTGDIEVGTTLTLSSTGSLLFDIDGDGVNNQISLSTYQGLKALNLDGAFAFDLTGASTTVGHSWQIVAVALTETYGGTFSVTGFTAEPAGVWRKTAKGVYYVYTESTGILSVEEIPPPAGTVIMFK